MLHSLLGQYHSQLVGQAIQLLYAYAARLRNTLQNHTPHLLYELLHLLAVCVRHLCKEVGLYGALVLTYRGAQDIHLHAELVNQPLEENRIHRHTRPVERTLGLHIDFVGHRCKIVASLRIYVVVSHNPLACALECLDCLAQLLDDGHIGHARACEVDVYTLYALVTCRRLNGAQCIV